ncbi:hypothetical protein ASO20_00585 [Mycoplasma sp. (ex Biomphalaria glabrata)]|uniref:ribosome biogenesis GTPase Der n=1 Tax=Mycoplasma sp. (ex Biomphalaria glabrata) TaxID=1749074 RepID=UPI00073AAC53|nr:ribosome biogenesis GTPase Der [Mycoplasma sp. (ex Biomphalaria glabrata)]ALV23173.1 hypothetical protein ASO20_00585 [Mycoplasma sp. (ex Biomphalaria glabrata)]
MMINNIVAIVGRPNVGKSTLFNRLTQTRDSITHDEPGVTRDRIYGEVNWKNKDFILIDTGGIQLKEHLNFQKEINIQAQFAIDEADIIIFLTSYEDQIVYDDEYVAKLLKKYPNKKVFIVANKFDGNDQNPEQEYLWEKLGFGKPFFVSSSHGINVGDLLNAITSYLEEHEAKPNPTSEFSFCLIGKPNVGKSSIANALVKEQRSIVSEIAGTTRDSVYIDLVYDKKHFTLVDTAGIKRMNRALDSIEEISILKTKLAIERSNFAVFVIDGSQSLSKMDLDIAATLNESEKPFLIIVNKSDMLNEAEIEKIKKELKVKLNYVDWAQVFFTSAINKKIFIKYLKGYITLNKTWIYQFRN